MENFPENDNHQTDVLEKESVEAQFEVKRLHEIVPSLDSDETVLVYERLAFDELAVGSGFVVVGTRMSKFYTVEDVTESGSLLVAEYLLGTKKTIEQAMAPANPPMNKLLGSCSGVDAYNSAVEPVRYEIHTGKHLWLLDDRKSTVEEKVSDIEAQRIALLN